MRTRSLTSQASDPYRAGLELGEGLSELKPEIVLLFSTVHYGRSDELLEGVSDGLENPQTLIIGNTGDGFFHHQCCGDVGCVAMGINSDGRVSWQWAMAQGVKEDPAGALSRAWSELQRDEGPPDLVLMFSDFRTDASQFEAVLREQIQVPVVGGIAADDNQMLDCAVFANRQCLEDSLVLVGLRGQFEFSIQVGNSISAVGKPGVIEQAEGTNILRIDGLSAMDFIERETGKPVLQSDRGITSLTILDSSDSEMRRLRSIVPDFSVSERSVGLYGGIRQGGAGAGLSGGTGAADC